tara:strand:+ start:1070 stop:1519 length:450 start_codon:yes stop_codon:yes gene_type:complete
MTKATDLLLAYENLDWEVYINLSEDLTKIDTMSIDDELSKQATVFSYYSGLYEHAKRDSEIKEIELTQAMADAKIKAQAECEATGKRPTANLLETYVNLDPACNEMSRNLTESKYRLGLLKSLMSSLSHKKDMLVQISANQRTEKGIYS